MKLTSRKVCRRPVRVLAAVLVAAATLSAVELTRQGDAQAVPAAGTAPVAYVTTSGPSVGAFQLSALGSEAGSIALPAGQQEATEVAIAPDDSVVVTIAGLTMNISSISGPSYVTPANSAPSSTVALAGPAYGLAISPDGHYAYTVVQFDAGDALVKVDLRTSSIVSAFSLFDQSLNMYTVAVGPDGSTAYLGGAFVCNANGGTCGIVDSMDTATGNILHSAPNYKAPGQVLSIAVTPDGQVVYAAGSFGTEVMTSDLVRSTLVATGNSTSVAVTPDGNHVYVAGRGADAIVHFAVTPATGPQPTPLPVANMPVEARRSGVSSLTISPDGSELVATTLAPDGNSADLLSLPLSGDNPAGPPADHPGGAGVRYGAIAITPDLAPVARLNAAPASLVAGQSTTIDASASSVAFGTINGFAWGAPPGGSCGALSGPTLSCTFPAPGSYTVGLREIDSAGTSTVATTHPAVSGVDFTGQTAYRSASNAAATSIVIRVAPRNGGTIPNATTTTTVSRTPTLHLSPTVGPPGTLVTVTGTGFTPHAAVTVTWSVSNGSISITADDSGDLPPTILPVLVPAVLGPRNAQAGSSPPAQASFLVIPSSAEPGGSGGSMLFRSEGP